MTEKKEFEFYAFISYKREDEHWAEWLQRQLETYRIPAVIRKQNRDVPEKIYPVFRDKTDLAGGKVLNQLHKELEDSRFLIVICSPNSAKSSWVDEEIRHFIELGREDYIIPFVVDGEPNAADPTRECFPEALRTDAQSELLGISVPELGRRKAFLRVEATLLSLKFDQLVMRDQKRLFKRRVIAASASVLVFFGAAFGLWYNMPHSSYFRNYVYRYEIPQGVGPVSRRERKKLTYCYEIVKRRGKVVGAECQNSMGKPIIPSRTSNEDVLVSASFFYEGDHVSRAEYRDEYGRKILVKNYTSNLKAVDFLRSDDSSQAVTQNADQAGVDSLYYTAAGLNSEFTDGKSRISRYLNTYDENGYLIEVLYMRDNLNTPTSDSNGIYGKSYERDEEGKIKKIVYLDEHGEPKSSRYGIMGVNSTYDEMGRPVTSFYFDADKNPIPGKDGYAGEIIIYDEDGNEAELHYLDEKEELCNSKLGYAIAKITYDADGFPVSRRYFDKNGKPSLEKSLGIYGEELIYDKKKNLIERRYCDTDMQPMNNNIGVAGCAVKYDAQGRTVEAYNLNRNGEPVYDNDGFCGIRYEYAGDGSLSARTCLDVDGQPLLSKFGYATERMQRDGAGNIVEKSYFDGQGQPTRYKDNYSMLRYAYDKSGNLSEVLYLDENGNPCACANGSAKSTYEYDDNGNWISAAYFDGQGQPVIVDAGYHMMRMKYDDKGNCVEQSFFDTQDWPMRMRKGYASKQTVYDGRGRITEESYLDVDGKSAFTVEGEIKAQRIESIYDDRGNRVCAVLIPPINYFTEPAPCGKLLHEYDEWGNIISESYLDEKQEPWSDQDGVARYTFAYDEQGRQVLLQMFDADGHPAAVSGHTAVRNEYDEKNRLAARTYYGEDGGLTPENILCKERYTYDNFGNRTEVFYEDKNGRSTDTGTGYYKERRVYDKVGNPLEAAYYDTDGNLCENAEGYAKSVMQYDTVGNCVETRFYDKSGEPALANQNFHRAVEEYSPQGWRLSITYYDDKGELIGGEDGLCKIEYRYDASGRRTQTLYYDRNGNEVSPKRSVIVIDDAGEGTGLVKGDLLLEYNDWSFFSYDNILEAKEALNQEVHQYWEIKKILGSMGSMLSSVGKMLVYRIGGDEEKPDFREIELGRVDGTVSFKEQACSLHDYDRIREQDRARTWNFKKK